MTVREMETGVSRYDYEYEMWRCCRCDTVVALSAFDEDRLIAREVAEWQHYDTVLSHNDRARIEAMVHDRSAGYRLSRVQVIHTRCMLALSDDEHEMLRQKARFQLPLPREAYWFFRPRQYAMHHCEYCDGVIDGQAAGFGYQAQGSRNDPTTYRYLHDRCFSEELARQNQEYARAHMNDALVPPSMRSPPSKLDPLSVRKKNLEWADYLARFEADKTARQAYLAWRQTQADAEKEWSPDEKTQWEMYDRTEPEKDYDEKEYDAAALEEARRDRAQYTYPLRAEERREATTRLNMMKIIEEKSIK